MQYTSLGSWSFHSKVVTDFKTDFKSIGWPAYEYTEQDGASGGS